MYCKYCGQEINDEADVCIHCGRSTGNKPVQQANNYAKQEETSQPDSTRDKTGVGFLLSFFLGLIGLIIGVCMYPTATEERSTCMKGCVIGFIINIILTVILSVAIASSY